VGYSGNRCGIRLPIQPAYHHRVVFRRDECVGLALVVGSGFRSTRLGLHDADDSGRTRRHEEQVSLRHRDPNKNRRRTSQWWQRRVKSLVRFALDASSPPCHTSNVRKKIMPIENDIADIKAGLSNGRYKNEASVSQGIILRLLNSLGWSIFDSSQVSPEYSVGSDRVDFALCNLPSKPCILIESKDVGNAQGAERQLFEYAFHQGIPMAILTDGQEWNFFLPGEQGAYHERCVYKLDLSARSVEECGRIFKRYLQFDEVVSGSAFSNARSDYRNVSKKRQIESAMPEAWHELLREQDEILVELFADKVESLCGFKPEPDTVRAFLDQVLLPPICLPPDNRQQRPAVSKQPPPTRTTQTTARPSDDFSGFILRGQHYQERNAIETLFRVLEILSKSDPHFFQRYAALPKHGRKRRYLAQDRMQLYPGRVDLCMQYSQQKFPGWWIGTNYSRSTIRHAIELACEVADIRFGSDLTLT
jgi:predicted type IV restriction endonuclease